MKTYKILFLLLIVFFTINITVYAGFEYGDKSQFQNLEQFSGERYVIYKNADSNRIELAVVTVDDSEDRSLIIECEGQVDVPESKVADPINSHATEQKYIKYIAPIGKKKLTISAASSPYYTVKWYLEGNEWIKFEDLSVNQPICNNYKEVLYSDFPIIEKIYKEKTGQCHYRSYSGKYYVDFDAETIDSGNGTYEYKFYALFSDDGIKVDKKVEIPYMQNGGIGGACSGNNITIVMGLPNMVLSNFQRPKGFSSGGVYIFDENCELLETVPARGLQSCDGFYNGYFYFSSKIYTAKGQSSTYYTKSADGINHIDVTKEEYQEVIDHINDRLMETIIGKSIEFSWNKGGMTTIYLSDSPDSKKSEIVYETGCKIEDSTIAISSDLSGSIFQSKWISSIIDEEKNYITMDYIYKIRLPEIDSTIPSNPRSGYVWTTDDYVFVDQDIEYVLRIPMEQFKNQVYVQFSDKILAFEQPPIIEDGRTLVSMRFLFEQMGADVEWNTETKTAKATLNNTAVSFSIDDTHAEVNEKPVIMDVPARLINGKTMVPLRFLSEELGYTVTWDEETRTAVIE